MRIYSTPTHIRSILFKGLFFPGNDMDSCKLPVSGPGQIRFELVSVPEGLDLGMYVYDKDGNYWFYVDSKREAGVEFSKFSLLASNVKSNKNLGKRSEGLQKEDSQ